MNQPPTVLLLSYHFHPSIEIGARRTTALARYLVSQGMRVIVVSEFGGQSIAAQTEVFPGVIAIPVKQPRRLLIDAVISMKRKNAATDPSPAPAPNRGLAETVPQQPSIAARLRASLRSAFFRTVYFVDENKKWCWHASRLAIRASRKYGVGLVISSSPPHTMLLAGTWIANRLRVPHIADLRDPWTDLVAGARPKARIELAMLRVLEKWAVNSSTAITSTGARVAQLLADRYPHARPKMHVIRNGFDGAMNKAPETTGGRLAILFAGELYAGRNPFPLLTALENVLARPDVDASRMKLTFMGRCASYADQSLTAWTQDKRCRTAVEVLPQMPSEAVAQAVGKSTVLLNLAQNQPMSVPAKTYEHLASGREILLVCENESETAQVVAGINGVIQVDQSDPAALEQVLLDLYRRHAVEGKLNAPAEEDVFRFSRTAANQQFMAIISSAMRLKR